MSGRACQHCRKSLMAKLTGRPALYCSSACRNAAARRRRKRTKPYFLTGTPEWGTPQELFDQLDAEFGFTLDVCATPENAKCPRFLTRADDALTKPWDGVCWMNPPYGRDLGHWVAKAYDTARAGHTVVCLLPARTDTAWWRELAHLGEVKFLRGRVRFTGGNGATSAAPFPSCLLIFRPALRNGTDRYATRHETAATT